MEPEDELIGIPEAAAIAKVTPDYLRKQAKVGRLRAKKLGRDWATTRKWLHDWRTNPDYHKRGKRAKSG